MRLSQRQWQGIVGRNSAEGLRGQIAALKSALDKEPLEVERVVIKTLPAKIVEKIVEKIVKVPVDRIVEKKVEVEVEKIVTVEKRVEIEVPGPVRTVEKLVDKIVEVAKPQPIYSFAVKERNPQGRIIRMVASSAQSETRFDFRVLRDAGGNLTRITMKAVKPAKDSTIYDKEMSYG